MKKIQGKDKVIYQIFPRSFYDSNNDGDGDLKGITSKLDYLQDLGIDAIGLCPIYDTNFADAGYDVKDYMSVGKQFGTIDDFKELATEAKKRGIDIIMDIVLNHVSNEHPGFKKACESVDNIEHNYFIGREKLAPEEKEAKSVFGGSAGEYVPSVNKYYFHIFAKEQVDLNGEHPDTISAMVEIIDFGYELGVKGFRLDAIKHISKVFPEGNDNVYSGGPTTVPQLQKFNEEAFGNKDDAFILGEASGITLDEARRYGTGTDKVSSNFYNFSGGGIGGGKETGRNGYDANGDYRNFVGQMQQFQEADDLPIELLTNFLSNHDTSRAISRGGDERFFGNESAKTLAMMMFLMRGIPCVYYGEEIGMLNPRFKDRSEFRDVDALNSFKIFVDEDKIYSEDEMTKYHNMNSRDNCRTPMIGNSSENYGFNTGANPGIKFGFGSDDINVESQLGDKNSILNFYKKIIKLRKSDDFSHILIDGDSRFELLESGAFSLTRTSKNGEKIKALINMTSKSMEIEEAPKGRVILSSGSDNKEFKGKLRPYESIMFAID